MANGLMLTRERGHEIVVSLTDVTQLFAAPDSNPFALTEVEVLGDTGLARVIQRMLAWRVGLSIALFIALLLAWKLGYIQPTGLPAA